MVQLINVLLTQCAGALMAVFQRIMPEYNGWIGAIAVGLVLGMLPPFALLTLSFLLKAGRQGHLAGMADEARPIARRLTDWTALVFISVPFNLTGETHHRRCDLAAELFADGRASVASVTTACGFSDPAYFSRGFRRLRGTSPALTRAAAATRLD